MSGKKRQTFGKLTRERARQEKRERKQEKKDERKQAAAEGRDPTSLDGIVEAPAADEAEEAATPTLRDG